MSCRAKSRHGLRKFSTSLELTVVFNSNKNYRIFNYMIKARKGYSIIFLLFISFGVFSQNIIPNGSFETFTTCPTNINSGFPDQVANAVGWYRADYTPDYLSSCVSYTPIGTPTNFFGYQIPASGNSYMGMWCYNSTMPNYREILGAQLTNTLVIGQKYFIKLTISNAERYQSNCGIDKMGMRFSTVKHTPYNVPINNFAHLFFNSIMADTLNWKTVFSSFTADSNYQYVEIGHFFNDLNTNIQIFRSEPANLAYYYIDDVALSTDSLEALGFNSTTYIDELKPSNKIKIYPNPADNYIWLENYDQIKNFRVYDLLQNEVKVEVLKDRLDISNISPGIYFLFCELGNEVYKSKIIKK
jgi:hypothetical protein